MECRLHTYLWIIIFCDIFLAYLIMLQLLSKSASVRGFLLFHFAKLYGKHFAKLAKMYHRGDIKSFVDLGQTTRYNKGLQSIPEAIDVSLTFVRQYYGDSIFCFYLIPFYARWLFIIKNRFIFFCSICTLEKIKARL